ncbi:MAG: helix-turn-helix domain-containing protein [Terracidiphilus sp.]|jgi:AcrR family transcriptional regulator
MVKPLKTLEPQQARSRESLRKLLKAAAEVLGQHGVEGATIPRIAEHAGLTPGAVYRRFRDKDTLLETVVLGILERQERTLRLSLPEEMAAKIPFAVLAEQLINSMVISYRSQAGLLRAIRQFVQGKENTPFWKKATKLEFRAIEYLVDLLASKRGEIHHRDPRIAVALGLRMVTCTLMELVLNPSNDKSWKGLMPKDDQALKRELLLSFLNYVGLESPGTYGIPGGAGTHTELQTHRDLR